MKIFSDPLAFDAFELTTSEKGKPLLVDNNGYTYRRQRQAKKTDRIYWQCSKSKELKCTGRVVTSEGQIITRKNEHNHPVFPSRKSMWKVENM